MKTLLALCACCGMCFYVHAQTFYIQGNPDNPQISFAIDEIQKALAANKIKAVVGSVQDETAQGTSQIIVLSQKIDAVDEILASYNLGSLPSLDEEGFSIRSKGKTYLVVGGAGAGAMYGGLELAEIIRTDKLSENLSLDKNPYMGMRGTKFNIPLDVRTPSYSDMSDAGQKNIPEMWSMDFWKEYIDNLARYRYNYISLWNLHPFPSLVKVPDYPNVALDDVHRSTHDFEEFYTLQGRLYDAPEIVDNYEVVEEMTIDEKIRFWREVMAYGKSRNVDFYIVTWNVFDYGTQGKYGITDDLDNEITKDYFRKSITQLFLTYQDLKGIGLTTGENMEGADFEAKEDWMWETYGLGVLDVFNDQPDREITFLHRQHQAGAVDIAERFKPLAEHPNVDFIFSFKYAQAHVYSSTTQIYHPEFVEEISNNDLKTIWTLRNDDIYHFRWGAPDYVREFIKNIPYDVSRGYYYGSDQYIWGLEFLNTEPSFPRNLEIVKHWYHWMIWGRLGYDPDMSNQQFVDILGVYFKGVDAQQLFDAWQEASFIYPKVTGFHWGRLDFQWYIEGGKSRKGPAQNPVGFHDLNRFISLPPHAGTNYVSIPDYVENQNIGSGMKSPLDIADEILHHSDQALVGVDKIEYIDNRELRQTVKDIKAMAYLGKYYGHKIKAATHLAFFRKNPEEDHQQKAIEEANQSAHYWRVYAASALSQNKNPLWTNRVGNVNWRETFADVVNEINNLGGDIDISSADLPESGDVLEAEAADLHNYRIENSVPGFSGDGYIQSSGAHRQVTWHYDASDSGMYRLTFRYSMDWLEDDISSLQIDGRDHDFSLWSTGSRNTWAWDQITVEWSPGAHTISLAPERYALIDCLQVEYVGK